MWRKLARFLFVLLLLAAILGSYGYLAFWYYFKYKIDDLPDVLALRNYNFNLSTVVRDDEGETINTFAVEHRIFISFKDLSDTVVKAVTYAEDKKFWSERLILGIDQTGIARAAWKNFLAGRTSWSRPWSLFVLNAWCRRHLDSQEAPVEPAPALAEKASARAS